MLNILLSIEFENTQFFRYFEQKLNFFKLHSLFYNNLFAILVIDGFLNKKKFFFVF